MFDILDRRSRTSPGAAFLRCAWRARLSSPQLGETHRYGADAAPVVAPASTGAGGRPLGPQSARRADRKAVTPSTRALKSGGATTASRLRAIRANYYAAFAVDPTLSRRAYCAGE